MPVLPDCQAARKHMYADSFFVTANLIEAGLWALIGLGLITSAISRKQSSVNQRLSVIAGLAFLAFGLSDVVETHTGAWWRPWWLFAWKAGCVLTLAILLGIYLRGKRRSS